jgi:hypothetical protein
LLLICELAKLGRVQTHNAHVRTTPKILFFSVVLHAFPPRGQGGKPQPGKPAFLSTSPANTHQLQMGSCSTIFYLLRIESGCSLSDH